MVFLFVWFCLVFLFLIHKPSKPANIEGTGIFFFQMVLVSFSIVLNPTGLKLCFFLWPFM